MSESEPMTVARAVAVLERIAVRRGSSKLVVPYDAGRTMIGPTPSKQVLTLHEGLDWDHDSVFVGVGPLLQAPCSEIELQRQLHNDAVDTIGRIALQVRAPGLSPEEKLQRIAALVKGFGEKGRSKVDAAPAAGQA